MNYKECKEKYDIYTKCLESKKSQLVNQENKMNIASSEYDNVSSIVTKAKEELENSQRNLDCYTVQKFSISQLKLGGILALLSIGAVIILGCSGTNGFSYAMFGTLVLFVTDAIIMGVYSFIEKLKPQFIQSFWKKDKKFNELKELVKEKEKELSIAEINMNRVFDRFNKCRKSIINLEDNIAYIEHDIMELMLTYDPTLFSEEVDEQDKYQEKPYTRIRK